MLLTMTLALSLSTATPRTTTFPMYETFSFTMVPGLWLKLEINLKPGCHAHDGRRQIRHHRRPTSRGADGGRDCVFKTSKSVFLTMTKLYYRNAHFVNKRISSVRRGTKNQQTST